MSFFTFSSYHNKSTLPETSTEKKAGPELESRPLYRKSDFLFILLFLLLAGSFYWARIHTAPGESSSLTAEIYVDDQLVKTISLADHPAGHVSIEERPGVVFHLDGQGGIGFEESPCPDKICIRTGMLHQPGDVAICLPEKTLLLLRSAAGSARTPEPEGDDVLIGIEAPRGEKP